MNDYARHLRNNATESERRLWQRLRRRQLNGYKSDANALSRSEMSGRFD
jgi:very-short-patch-repair endonuclease